MAIDTSTTAAQLAEDAAERFLRYVRIDTQSEADSKTYPSTEKQLDLLRLLIAEIVAAVAYLQEHPEIPHGPVKVAFNPDEEIGRGVTHFPVESFGVVAAYTVDGSTAGEVQSETFSGAQVRMYIRGRAIHPGWAKGELVNAIKLAAAIVEKLPKDSRSPETTEDREGYVHPVVISGDSSEVELRFIARDFEDDALDEHVEFLRGIAQE